MMKPNTRLLIRLTLPNGDMKGWGYDEPFYETAQQLHDSIVADFQEFPENEEVRLFYLASNNEVKASTAEELADTAVDWLKTQGVFH